MAVRYNKLTMDNALRRSIRTTSLIFSAVFSVGAYKCYPSISSYAFSAAALIVLSIALYRPAALGPLFQIWLKIGRAIGKFNAVLLLGLIFFLVFLPFRVITGLFGRDFMKRTVTSAASYWEDYTLAGLGDEGRYERQF